MPKVVLPSDMTRFTGGVNELEVAARNYRALVAELCERFPDLTVAQVRKFAIAIDGMIVQEPMLETFRAESEVVLVAKIAGG